ncbi:MAG: hypothetical protein E6Q44_04305 [Flavobacteriales bacterium]|nr:MAG: hypothetical protein E6Q44_04305 [Flavobacteriales bacterium]
MVAYLRAWAANDVATMQSNSAPDSPARAYADYWGSVYDAGRLDVGQADLRIREDSAVLTYTDGNAYRLSGFETDQGGVVTWKAVPGGPLATRIRTGQTTIRIAGVRVTAGTQYENTESSVRIVLDVHNNAKQRRDLEAPVYVSPDGSRSASALGADGRTGVIPVSPGSTQTGLVAAADAQIGGRLQVRVFDRAGQVLGAKTLALPN